MHPAAFDLVARMPHIWRTVVLVHEFIHMGEMHEYSVPLHFIAAILFHHESTAEEGNNCLQSMCSRTTLASA